MKNLVTSFVVASTLFAVPACYSEEPDAQYPGEPDDGSADLVEISPGVEVIADYDEPIFFVDDFYWVFRGGFWYRSGWYGGGWARAEPPDRVRGIANPGSYAHYRPAGWVRHEPVHGGYASHAQYHASHAAPATMHVRAAVHASHSGGGGHHR